MRAASREVMPDFDPANDTHRIISGEINANRSGYRAAQQITRKPPSDVALGVPKKDPAAFMRRSVPEMTPTEAQEATRGALSGLQSKIGVNPVKDWRALSSGSKLLRATDARGGRPQTFLDLIRGAQTVGGIKNTEGLGTFLAALFNEARKPAPEPQPQP